MPDIIKTQSGKTRIAGVIGWPIDHSLSPRLHGFWLAQYRIDGVYLPFATRPENLGKAIRALPALGIQGTNITLPHKERALDFVDRISPIAKRIGAINTLIVEKDGSISAENTDAYGFIQHLKTSASHWRADAGPCVVLGAGGAARAIVAALIDEGINEVRLINRTTRRAEEIADHFQGSIKVMSWDGRNKALQDAALLVNTTRLGMQGQPGLDLDLTHLPQHAIVNDIVYVPLETELLRAAKKRGNVVVDGLGMLLYQAKPGFAAWFGIMPEVTSELRSFVLSKES